MKSNTITKKIINSLLVFSIIIFISSVVIHGFITSATAIGSNGGRISVVTTTLCPPYGTTPPCSCGTFHTTIQPAVGSIDPIYCFTYGVIPNAGGPITVMSVGKLLLGNFTSVYPVALSINWGTSLMGL